MKAVFNTFRRLARSLGVSAPRASTPDGTLLEACTEYCRIREEMHQVYADLAELEPSEADTEDHQHWADAKQRFTSNIQQLYESIMAMPAATLDGVTAKAKVVAISAKGSAQ
jgi:hypothetical protein